MSKILIINSYSWYNEGDAAIIIGTLHALREHMPDAEITVLSMTPDVDREKYRKYDNRVQVLSNLLIPPVDYSKKLATALKYSFNIIKYTSIAKLHTIKNLADQTLRAYVNTDLVISCGGDYIGGYQLGYLAPFYGMYLAKLLGKPVIVWAQSAEPFGNVVIEKVNRFVLDKVDVIITRDNLSADYLEHLALQTPVCRGADAGYLFTGLPPEQGERLLADEEVYKNTEDLRVGVSAREWVFPQCRRGERMRRADNYLSVIVETIKWLISELNARVVVIPFCAVTPPEDDRVISKRLANAVGSDRVTLLTRDYSPEELRAMIGHMDLFIGTRLHSNIFSTSMYVPTIAISYKKKTDGMMALLGMGDYVLDINALRLEDMISKIEGALANKMEIKEILTHRVAQAKKLALDSARLAQVILSEQTKT
ncbi:polysaccharide pyruvyl transferase family protein [Chloroflexota bacterium]